MPKVVLPNEAWAWFTGAADYGILSGGKMDKLTMGERIVLAAGALLIIDLVAFPWHSYDLGLGSVDRTGVQSSLDSSGAWGWLALIVLVVMIAQIVVSKFTDAKLPDLPLSWGQVHMIAGITVLALVLLKVITDLDDTALGLWIGVILAAAVAYGGFMINKESPAAAGGTRDTTLPPPV